MDKPVNLNDDATASGPPGSDPEVQTHYQAIKTRLEAIRLNGGDVDRACGYATFYEKASINSPFLAAVPAGGSLAKVRKRKTDARSRYSTKGALHKEIERRLDVLREEKAELTLPAVRDTMGFSSTGWKKMLVRLEIDDSWVWGIISRFKYAKDLEDVKALKN